MTLKLESSAFAHDGEIPRDYTCEGENNSPPLSWSGLPPGTQSLVLIVDDPDAPDPLAPKMTWVHWVVINIPPLTNNLAEGASPGNMPINAIEGLNDWKHIYYEGPCPPIGRHRYFHKLYALDAKMKVPGELTREKIEIAMEGHVLEQAILIGTYEKI